MNAICHWFVILKFTCIFLILLCIHSFDHFCFANAVDTTTRIVDIKSIHKKVTTIDKNIATYHYFVTELGERNADIPIKEAGEAAAFFKDGEQLSRSSENPHLGPKEFPI